MNRLSIEEVSSMHHKALLDVIFDHYELHRAGALSYDGITYCNSLIDQYNIKVGISVIKRMELPVPETPICEIRVLVMKKAEPDPEPQPELEKPKPVEKIKKQVPVKPQQEPYKFGTWKEEMERLKQSKQLTHDAN